MTAEKQICFSICICQMIAILSGVSLLYLAVIVIIPSKNELAMGFNTTPIMCTTVEAKDLAAGTTKIPCKWSTCGEWCLSKGSGTCMQIHVMVRNNGSKVNFRDCVDIADENCSALDVNKTHVRHCKRGQCKDLTGLFTCTRDGENECREITPAFYCYSRNIQKIPITCDEEKCKERLDGVFSCKKGECKKLWDKRKYWLDCERKCTNLEMRERNVVIFSRERLVATACSSMDSPDANTSASIESVSSKQEWRDKRETLMLFCSYVTKVKGNKTYDLLSADCFNATLGSVEEIQGVKEYMTLQQIHQTWGNRSDWVILPEQTLRIMNNTQLRINPEGCVNTLRKECTAFFESHAHDGFDGMTPDRYPCYFTDMRQEFVIGKFDPVMTSAILLVATILPGCLFVLACTCLFICSKSLLRNLFNLTNYCDGARDQATTPSSLTSEPVTTLSPILHRPPLMLSSSTSEPLATLWPLTLILQLQVFFGPLTNNHIKYLNY
ncbi:uncharacterized protein LOC121874550 isoform X2 [Homarus americanus]|uniref:uncharacterized protein LOC121874550 isoform X2 n=1 Tax=Homarus americanus TaxID=6706 RepID=UPI001C453780|nr:uncharacterized protein LOC121874550 isoform X2 [Homarus americanus]